MKKAMTVFGFIAAFFILIGAIFKIQHYPGASIMFLGVLFLAFLFAPMFLIQKLKESKNKFQKTVQVFIFLFIFFAALGFLFKMQHYPGASILIYLDMLLFILLIPLLIINSIIEKDAQRKINLHNLTILFISGASIFFLVVYIISTSIHKDVLNSFILVEYKLNQSIKTSVFNNEAIYVAFEKAYAKNNVKVEPSYDKANEVRKRSDELYNYIQELKIKIVKFTEGKESVFDGDVNDIEARGNAVGAAVVMIGPTNQGKANELRVEIENYREYLLSLVNEKDEFLRKAIEAKLETKDFTDAEGAVYTWQTEHFEHLPLIAVITLMSTMQSDIRYAEFLVINKLYNQMNIAQLTSIDTDKTSEKIKK